MRTMNGLKAISCLLLASCQMLQPSTKSSSAKVDSSCGCSEQANQNKIWAAKGFEIDRSIEGRHGKKSWDAVAPKSSSCEPCSTTAEPSPVGDELVWQRIKNSGKLVVGVKADAPPFSLQASPGEFLGFEVDLAKAVANNMGLQLELFPVSAKDRAPYVLQDKVDVVMATMTLTHNREEILDFSVPYFEVGQGLIVKSGSDIQGFMDLKDRPVVVLEGTQAYHTLSRIQPDCRLLIAHTYEEGIQMVLSGEAEALCSDHILLTGLLFEHESKMSLRLLQQTFAPDTYAIALKENESHLRDALNRALMKIWEDGTWQDTYETWFGQGSMYGHESTFRIDLIPE